MLVLEMSRELRCSGKRTAGVEVFMEVLVVLF